MDSVWGTCSAKTAKLVKEVKVKIMRVQCKNFSALCGRYGLKIFQ